MADLDGLVIAQLSDFHAGFTPSYNLRAMRKAVDIALGAHPDLVVITGDFSVWGYGRDEFQHQLRRLQPPLGVLGVLGNHDHGESHAPFVQPTDPAVIAAAGVRLLCNETVELRRGAAVLQVGGVDDSEGGHDDLPAGAGAPGPRAAGAAPAAHAPRRGGAEGASPATFT